MKGLPISLALEKRRILIIGSGYQATRKLSLLLKFDANQIDVVETETCSDYQKRRLDHPTGWQVLENIPESIDDYDLLVIATGNRESDADTCARLRPCRALINVLEQPDLSDFSFPSIVDRDPIVIGISSRTAAPTLARMLRTQLEGVIPQNIGRLAALTARWKERVRDAYPDVTSRRRFWENMYQGRLSEMVYAGKDKEAESYLAQSIQDAVPDEVGDVYLVGAGPGDPDLLTLKALRLMQKADVVVYDRLVSDPILDLCRRDAEFIHVGKQRANHALPQEKINQLLVDLAKQGKRVLRLKGGDPFIFGRGGEEIELLMENGIQFQVVPGITAASGCSSYTGIPLTHRDHAQSVVFATGHLKDNSINLNWKALAHKNQTLVFYMGLVGLSVIQKELIAHGMDSDTPVALVQKGTTPQQRVISAKLANIVECVEQHKIEPPTLIIVGTVVNLQAKLHWYEPNKC
jgi:uroporphyrin-III C-methyltransferase/precorrin-2 dehydrogenase/sirohydrochlorin ferrochelatase